MKQETRLKRSISSAVKSTINQFEKLNPAEFQYKNCIVVEI